MYEFFQVLVAILGVLMSLAHFPQAYRIMKRKSADDVSFATYLIFAVGCYVWLAYGLYIADVPIIASFFVGCIGATLVLILKLKYNKKKIKK